MAPGVSASTRSSVQPQSKRRRTGDYASSEICQSYHGNGGEVQIYEDDEEDAEEGSGEGADDGVNGQEEDDDVDEEQEVLLDDDDEDGTKYYDPEQPPEIRRIVRANIRNHHREIEGMSHIPTSSFDSNSNRQA